MVAWLGTSWIDLLQTAGVVGGLLISAAALRMDTKVRRTEVILRLTEAHRDIWERLVEQPSLARVLEPEVNLSAAPPSPAERRFVQLVILHLATVRQAVREGTYDASPGMDDDIREFLSLPIPRSVAESLVRFQPADFQDYLGRLME